MDSKVEKVAKATGVDGIEIFDTSCRNCKENGTETTGQYHCKFCGVMCEKCSAMHEKIPKSGHWAKKLEVIVKPPPAPTFNSFTKCEIHKEKISKYCIDCGELLCEKCMVESHSDCSTEKIDSLSTDMVRDTSIREARLQLEDLRVRNVKARKNKKNEMKHLAKQADTFVDKVLNVRKQVNALFDKMLEMIILDKNQFSNVEATLIEERILKSEEIDPVLHSAKLVLNDAYNSGSKQNLWVAIKKMDQLMNFYEKIIGKIEADKCDVKFEFVPSESLANILKETENIGKMKVVSSRLNVEESQTLSKGAPRERSRLSKKHFIKEHTNAILNTNQVRHPSPWSYNNKPPSMKTFTKLPAVSPQYSRKPSQLNLRSFSETPTRSKTMDSIDFGIKRHTSRDRTHTSMYYGSKTSRLDTKSRLRLSIKRLPHEDNIGEEEMDRNTAEAFGRTQNIKLTVLGKKEIRVQDDSDDVCITGSAFLRNGRLVMVDYNNKSLKLYSTDFTLITCLYLDERPWDVAACQKALIAISFPFVNSVHIYNTGTEITCTGTIKTDRKCHGVGYDRRTKFLYVACGEGIDARLNAYSLDGFIRRIIIPEQNVFHEPCFLSLSFDNTRIFISDLDNGIIGFDVDSGMLICQYKDASIKRYWGLTTDRHDHVFIATTGPDSLYVLTGDRNGQLLSQFDGDKKICSVSFDPITNRLLVSRWQSEEVELFHVVYSKA